MKNIKFKNGFIDRKSLINLLKQSKIFYINTFDQIEEYQIKQDLEDNLNEINEIIDMSQHFSVWLNAFDVNNNILPISYYPFINKKIYDDDLKVKQEDNNTIDIDESYSLQKIAEELSKIGENDDDYHYYKYSKLKELKDIKEQGLEKTLKFIKENTKK